MSQQPLSHGPDIAAAATSLGVVVGTWTQWLPAAVAVAAGLLTIVYTGFRLYFMLKDRKAASKPDPLD